MTALSWKQTISSVPTEADFLDPDLHNKKSRPVGRLLLLKSYQAAAGLRLVLIAAFLRFM